jgi:hypothetical protein
MQLWALPSHSDYEDYSLLGYDTIYFGATLLQNTGKHLLTYTATHSMRPPLSWNLIWALNTYNNNWTDTAIH